MRFSLKAFKPMLPILKWRWCRNPDLLLFLNNNSNKQEAGILRCSKFGSVFLSLPQKITVITNFTEFAYFSAWHLNPRLPRPLLTTWPVTTKRFVTGTLWKLSAAFTVQQSIQEGGRHIYGVIYVSMKQKKQTNRNYTKKLTWMWSNNTKQRSAAAWEAFCRDKLCRIPRDCRLEVKRSSAAGWMTVQRLSSQIYHL